MGSQPTLGYEPDPEALIEVLLHRLADDPSNVVAHQQLRAAALQRKAYGGPPAGMLAHLRRLPSDPVRRLMHFERLWSFDPGNLDLLAKVSDAVEVCAGRYPELDFHAVRHWLHRLAEAARAGA